jgi:hypothetical protein
MLTGSLYVADSLESGVAISGYKNSGFVRSLGYEGFDSGFPGFLLWSGSALTGSLTKYNQPYSGVGLELYLNTSSYFRYSTADDEIYVATNNFFFGNPNGTFISGSNGLLQISSSGFVLNTNGTVTASAFTAVNGSTVLFDSNNEFADGNNIGRVVYFNTDEYSFNGNLNATPQTASIFETFILPGETRMQVSYMYEFTDVAATGGSIRGEWYIQSASITGSGTLTGYDQWSTPQSITNGFTPITLISNSTAIGGSATRTITATGIGITRFENHQGCYVRVFLIVQRNTVGNSSDLLKLKGFVYRTSRLAGGAVSPPILPIRE